MPGWLQAFAKVNPITVIAEALRVLCLGGPTAGPVTEKLFRSRDMRFRDEYLDSELKSPVGYWHGGKQPPPSGGEST